MKQHEITSAIFEHMKQSNGLLPVKYPDGQQFDHGNDPYLVVYDTPNNKVRGSLSSHIATGIITVLVMYKKSDYGDEFGKIEGGKIADIFKDGSKIGDIEIYQPPLVKSFVDKKNGWWFNPVSVSYKVKICR